MKLQNIDKALECYAECERLISEDTNQEIGVGYQHSVLMSYGMLLMKQGNTMKGAQLMMKSLDVLDASVPENQALIYNSCKYLKRFGMLVEVSSVLEKIKLAEESSETHNPLDNPLYLKSIQELTGAYMKLDNMYKSYETINNYL